MLMQGRKSLSRILWKAIFPEKATDSLRTGYAGCISFHRVKIEAGVLRACHKRPVSAAQITQLVDEVETEVFNMEEKEIPSEVIGELVMNKLKELDAVAYVRFASVYREFKDINTFMDELKSVLKEK